MHDSIQMEGMPTHGDLFRISEEWASGYESSRRDFISRAKFWDYKLIASFLVWKQGEGKDVDTQLAGCVPNNLCTDQRTARSLSPQHGGLPNTAHKELTSNQQPLSPALNARGAEGLIKHSTDSTTASQCLVIFFVINGEFYSVPGNSGSIALHIFQANVLRTRQWHFSATKSISLSRTTV